MSVPEAMLDCVSLYCGDCLAVLPTLPAASVDAVATDPPYHLTMAKRLAGSNPTDVERNFTKTIPGQGVNPFRGQARGFMGKVWDGGDIAFRPETWAAVARVMKPGAHLAAFGGTRTFHRMMVAIEDAGLELRDTLMWVYGQGFPKSHNVSKAIDHQAGAMRKVIGTRELWGDNAKGGRGGQYANGYAPAADGSKKIFDITAPATPQAAAWDGFGTSLKPAWEPIALFRKPLVGTIAQNVLAHGTGAINVDGCRVEAPDGVPKYTYRREASVNCYGDGKNGSNRTGEIDTELGRWPANVLHDGSDEVVELFPDSSAMGNIAPSQRSIGYHGGAVGTVHSAIYSDHGSAARFFYTAKADGDDRLGSKHPTVKPLDLMQWLVRLITPPGGLVLDPFAGTGPTGEAAWREKMRAVLIEADAEYQNDIRRRMRLVLASAVERKRETIKARGQVEEPGPLFAMREAAE